MKSHYRIAIVGNKETILGFKALGVKTFSVNDAKEAVEILYKLKSEEVRDEITGEMRNLYAIIFITEDLAMGIENGDYKKLSSAPLPAIVPVPGSRGSTGYGIRRIGKMVEQAVGSDIFQDK